MLIAYEKYSRNNKLVLTLGENIIGTGLPLTY